MLQNYLKIALRNLLRHKAFSFINVFGLALGMAACLLILQYVTFEMSYDKYHKNVANIYRLGRAKVSNGHVVQKAAVTEHALGPVLKKDYPEVEAYTRLHPVWGGGIITYYQGADVSKQKITFRLKGYSGADTATVAGNFNNWNFKEHLLKKEGNDWVGQIELIPGEYTYKFWVDGKDFADPTNPVTVTEGEKGEYINSILKVAPLPASQNKSMSREVSFKEDGVMYYGEPTLFSIFSFPVIKGTAKALDDPNTVLLSETTAKKIFGNEDPLDKTILLGKNEGFVVKGVFKDIPENSHLRFSYIFSFKNILEFYKKDGPWDWSNFTTYASLKPDANPKVLDEKFKEISTKYFAEDEKESGSKITYLLQPLSDIHLKSDFVHESGPKGDLNALYFLLVIALFILIIAYVNYINLSTVKSIERSKEVGVRKVTGATRAQLIRQFLLESTALNLAGILIAITIVQIFQSSFNTLTGKTLSLFGGTNLYFWFILSALFCIGAFLSGLYPAFVISSFEPVKALKGKIRLSSGINLRKSLVVLQFTASIALIVGTFTVYRQLDFMRSQKLGFNASQTLIVKPPRIPVIAYSSKLNSFRSEVKRLAAVGSFSLSSNVPGHGYSWGTGGIRRENEPESEGKDYNLYWANEAYIPSYEMKLLGGRNFSENAVLNDHKAIVNETALKQFGYNNVEEATNARIIIEKEKYTIIGVLKNYHHSSLKERHDPIILLYGKDNSNYISIKVKGKDIRSTIASVNGIWDKVFPGNTMEYYFLDDAFNDMYKSDERFGQIFGLFAALAIIVAGMGLFGLSSFTILQRTKEIGVRKVLGASIANILLLLSQDFIRLIFISIVIATPLSWFVMNKWLQNFAFRTHFTWWLFAIPALLVLLIAIATITLQTLKTVRANPVKALRYE